MMTSPTPDVYQLLAAMLEHLQEFLASPESFEKTERDVRARCRTFGFVWNEDGTEVTFVSVEDEPLHDPIPVKDLGYSLEFLTRQVMHNTKELFQARAACRAQLASANIGESGDEGPDGLQVVRKIKRPARHRTVIVDHQIDLVLAALEQPGVNVQATELALQHLRKLRDEEDQNQLEAAKKEKEIRAHIEVEKQQKAALQQKSHKPLARNFVPPKATSKTKTLPKDEGRDY